MRNHFIIAKERSIQTEEGDSLVREVIAEVPAITGVYETGEGELVVTVFKPSKKDNTRKVVFSGESVAHDGKRRVVNFPASPKKEVRQPFGQGEHLIFSQKANALKQRR